MDWQCGGMVGKKNGAIMPSNMNNLDDPARKSRDVAYVELWGYIAKD